MRLATGDMGADLSKVFSKKSLEIVLEADFLASSAVSGFGKTKRRKPLNLLGFQRFLSSDIFDYFAVISDFSKSLENRLPSRAREFESHTLRQRKEDTLWCPLCVAGFVKKCEGAKKLLQSYVLFDKIIS